MYSIVDGDNSRFFGVTDDGQIYVKQPLNPPDRQPVIRVSVYSITIVIALVFS